MDHSDLGCRMKRYEKTSKQYLLERLTVALRIDGKSFHVFTKGFKKPFDDILIKSMQETTLKLCENIQGCVLGYTQSDEISLILVNYKHLNSSSWFDNQVQKICSVAASMATLYFNKQFIDNVYIYNLEQSLEQPELDNIEINNYIDHLYKSILKGAMFDTRCFNLPKEEVTNYIYWRQVDAIRNSKQMVGHRYFSDSELDGKSCAAILNMLITERNIDWNDYPIHKQRGTCVVKDDLGKWTIDENIPIFKGDDRDYIEKLIYF